MKDIAVACVISTAVAVVVGLLIDSTVASTAFSVVFPSVILAREKSERERRSRAEDDVTGTASPAPSGRFTTVAALLDLDWRRVALGTVATVVMINLTVILGSLVALAFVLVLDRAALMLAPMAIAASIMLGMGFWVGRTSRRRGFLGAVLMGSIVGLSVPLALLAFGGLEREPGNVGWAFFVFTSLGVVLASAGGWLGERLAGEAALKVAGEAES